MALKESEADRIQKVETKVLMEKMALALDVWQKAGEIGGGILKERLGGRVFTNAKGLMVSPTIMGADFRCCDSGVRIYGDCSAELLEDDKLLLEPLDRRMGEIEKLLVEFDLVSGTKNEGVYVYRGEIFQPGKDTGVFRVQISVNEEGISSVFYDLDLWEERNIPGAFLREQRTIKDGQIAVGLQIIQGPPRRS